MTDVLEHKHRIQGKAILRVNQLLKPDGLLLVTFPDIDSIESRYYRALSRLLRRDWIWITCRIPGHTWEFTHKTASSLFSKSGFESDWISPSVPAR